VELAQSSVEVDKRMGPKDSRELLNHLSEAAFWWEVVESLKGKFMSKWK